MTTRRITALLLSAMLCFSAASCSDKEKGPSSSAAKTSAPPKVESGVGELITPAEEDVDSGLGSYRMSEYGTKLYYDSSVFSDELALSLDKYFKSIHDEDYETYKSCLFPSYLNNMETYLQKDFQYGMDTSFSNQCARLKALAAENYTITRIKIDKPQAEEGASTEEDYFSSFFGKLGECFGTDYYQEVKDNTDKLNEVNFTIMAEFDGAETVILSDMKIVVAEKDGVFYNFG